MVFTPPVSERTLTSPVDTSSIGASAVASCCVHPPLATSAVEASGSSAPASSAGAGVVLGVVVVVQATIAAGTTDIQRLIVGRAMVQEPDR